MDGFLDAFIPEYELHAEQPWRWLEPAAGKGAIIDATGVWMARTCREVPRWDAVEIQAKHMPQLVRSVGNADRVFLRDDFLTWRPFARRYYDVLVTNPPYSLALEYAKKGLEVAKITALLLRLNFLASEERCQWMQRNTPSILVLPNRPSFKKFERRDKKTGKIKTSSSDATEYAWFVWGLPGTPFVRVLDTTLRGLRCLTEST